MSRQRFLSTSDSIKDEFMTLWLRTSIESITIFQGFSLRKCLLVMQRRKLILSSISPKANQKSLISMVTSRGRLKGESPRMSL